jgi:hypothetical protein
MGCDTTTTDKKKTHIRNNLVLSYHKLISDLEQVLALWLFWVRAQSIKPLSMFRTSTAAGTTMMNDNDLGSHHSYYLI